MRDGERASRSSGPCKSRHHSRIRSWQEPRQTSPAQNGRDTRVRSRRYLLMRARDTIRGMTTDGAARLEPNESRAGFSAESHSALIDWDRIEWTAANAANFFKISECDDDCEHP